VYKRNKKFINFNSGQIVFSNTPWVFSKLIPIPNHLIPKNNFVVNNRLKKYFDSSIEKSILNKQNIIIKILIY
jgi:hypothetical protein